MNIIAKFESWSTNVYRTLNTRLSEMIAPLAFIVEQKLQYRKEKRDTWHSARIARVLCFTVAGEEVITVPNMLSALRPLLTLTALLPMRIYGAPTWLIATVFALAMLTDKLDGTWALLHGHTRFGEVLDPICDKLSLVIFIIPDFTHLPAIIMYALLAFESALFLLVIIAVYAIHLGILSHEVRLTANIFGKVKFTTEVVAMSLLIFHAHAAAAVFFALAAPFAFASIVRKTTDIIRSAPKAHSS